MHKRSDGKSRRFATTGYDGSDGAGAAIFMRFFLRTGDTAIDSSRRGKKSTLVGDDMVVRWEHPPLPRGGAVPLRVVRDSGAAAED